MDFRDDNRAVTVQIGAILLFATLVIALSLFQVTVVPSENADIEYKHSQTVQSQLSDVRNGILRTAASGATQPASVTLGTEYPSRIFLVNPPAATGTLSTEPRGEIRLQNTAATVPETNDYFAAEGFTWTSQTRTIRYQPNYWEYENAPARLLEGSILSNYYPENENTSAIPISEQLLVNQETDTITIVAVNGSLSTAQTGAVSVNPEALSAPYESVPIEPETGNTLTLIVPTQVSSDTLAARTSLDDANVSAGPVNNSVQITLTGNYTLQTAKIGVGSGTTDPGPQYLTTTENTTVSPNEKFSVVVRDRFNNPVGDQQTVVSVDPGLVADADGQKQVSADGTVSFTYTGAGSDPTASILGGGSAELEVTFDGRAGGGGGGGGGGDSVGPDITAATVAPDPVAEGQTVTLNATIDDTDGRGGLDIAAGEWFRATPNESVTAADPGEGNGTPLSFSDRKYYAVENVTDTADTTGWAEGTHTIAFRGQDTNGNWGPVRTETVTVSTTQTLITAVQPSPGTLADSDGEFVQLEIPAGVDTSGWTLTDTDNQNTSITQNLNGTVYFARNPTQFNNTWNVDDPVYELQTLLANTGDSIDLLDSAGSRIDRFSYESGDGETFADGTTYTFDAGIAGQVAYRLTDGSGDYIDTDSESDWADQDESTYFQTPTISNINLAEDGSGNVVFSFTADQSLTSITVTVDGPSTTDVYTFDETDFSEADNGDGTFTYTLTTTQAFDDGTGTYTATVDNAINSAGNNGGENGAGSGLSDTHEYTTGGGTGTIAGTVQDANTGNALENVDVTVFETGTSTVVATATTNATGQYSVDVGSDTDYDVEIDGAPIGYSQDTTTGVQVTAGGTTTVDAALRPVTVFARSPDFGNNNEIDSTFEVTDGQRTVSFTMNLNEQGNNWRAQTVSIDGTTYTLTNTAANAISSNTEVDLLDASNYQSVQQSELDQYELAINSGSVVVNQTDAGKASVSIRVGERP